MADKQIEPMADEIFAVPYEGEQTVKGICLPRFRAVDTVEFFTVIRAGKRSPVSPGDIIVASDDAPKHLRIDNANYRVIRNECIAAVIQAETGAS